MPRTGLEPAHLSAHAPETCASTNSATWAFNTFCSKKLILKSGKRDSDPRPQPWQGCALPTELFPLEIKLKIPKDADSSPSYFAPAKLILINETTKQNNIFFIFGMVLALRNANQFWLVYCRENARESRFGNRRGKIREYFAC